MRISAALLAASRRLGDAGIDTPGLDARLLLGEALGASPAELILSGPRDIDPDAARRFEAMLARRTAREPVSRILGRREFYGREFALAPAVLDPRPDTETLIEIALGLLDARLDADPGDRRPRRILDLGTGTGAILLTLLAERPGTIGIGTDIDEAALAVANGNADALGLDHRAAFLKSDWMAAITETFDLVTSNPPYIGSGALADLAPEVAAHDPRLALDGGPDGLDAYRRIAAGVSRVLAPGGSLVVEIGADQGTGVAALFGAAGMDVVGPYRDLAGRPRVLVANGPPGNAARGERAVSEKALGMAGRSG